jgi:hypothetical protein
VQGTDVDSESCQSAPYVGSAVGLQTYNITTERQILDLYLQRLAEYPQLRIGSRLYYEGYSLDAVKAVDANSSAFPMRGDNHLL